MDTYTRRSRRLSIFRRAGWLAVVSMVALWLAGPSAGVVSAAPVANHQACNNVKSGADGFGVP